jgi:ABC-type transporter MlaC component
MLAQTALPAEAQVTGKETVQSLFTLFSAWSEGTARQSIFEEAARHIDYATMAELAFTPAQWDTFSPPQKRQLISSFRTLIEAKYYKRWQKLFLRARLSIASEARAGSDIYVKTFLTEGKYEDTVIWRLRLRNGEPMVVSLNVNGKDLITRISPRFQRKLRHHGPQAVVVWLKDEADEESEEREDDYSRRAANK